jgi:hypothetical protein
MKVGFNSLSLEEQHQCSFYSLVNHPFTPENGIGIVCCLLFVPYTLECKQTLLIIFVCAFTSNDLCRSNSYNSNYWLNWDWILCNTCFPHYRLLLTIPTQPNRCDTITRHSFLLIMLTSYPIYHYSTKTFLKEVLFFLSKYLFATWPIFTSV